MVDVVLVDEKLRSERRNHKTTRGLVMQQTRVHGINRFLRGGHLSGGSSAVSASSVAHIRGEYEDAYIERQGADNDENRDYGSEFNSGDTL
jgi:hypothetical protein